MQVNDQYLEKLCRPAEYELKHHNSSLCLRDALAIDLRDARARIAKLESIIKTLHEELKDRYYVREDCGGYDPSFVWFDRLEELMVEKGVQL